MKKLVRLFLLCIMIATIPVQGIAAATMLYCGTEHHHALSSDQSQHEQNEHHHDVVEKSSDHSQPDTSSKFSKNKCSSCAACCVGAAMVTGSLLQSSPSPSSEKITQIFSCHIGHISDGLERPPRA
ncbi:hypothetical protein LPB67_12785 [Undibacterium sp. Jales W-56]|uniref:hypothetical protein n=1 Tax=Undibacterium sp. Jales W-56 TaxID=2897325 RepID=UPI0021CE1394|nr:hypothetical protein [Undibacterium sp. Jales W-56]MCU6434647.1 hypothetical protein [Undibacterium sp. Jales W-56]